VCVDICALALKANVAKTIAIAFFMFTPRTIQVSELSTAKPWQGELSPSIEKQQLG